VAVFQKTIRLAARSRGFHLVTDEVVRQLPELRQIERGILHLFIQHTSASLAINENADASVRDDFESHFNVLAPENAAHYTHDAEGPDDMPAHLKAAMLGCSVTAPITGGRLNLGTWQGIYLGEHRDRASSRTVVATIVGE
jgi:secondary thiamine-phosphate synthase enzyme